MIHVAGDRQSIYEYAKGTLHSSDVGELSLKDMGAVQLPRDCSLDSSLFKDILWRQRKVDWEMTPSSSAARKVDWEMTPSSSAAARTKAAREEVVGEKRTKAAREEVVGEKPKAVALAGDGFPPTGQEKSGTRAVEQGVEV